MSSSGILAWTESALALISQNIVHPVYFPYPWAPVLHAARISLVFQTLSRKNENSWKKLLWGPYVFGYLVACWGGGILTHLSMGLPPPHFYSFHPWINYIVVHVALTGIFNMYPSLLVPKVYDTLLFPLDGLLRAHAVVSAMNLFISPSISNPLSALSTPNPYQTMDSAFGRILLGILSSAVGGITLNTLSLWSDEWRFATPPILKATLWGSADVWGGGLAAVLYSSAIHTNAFSIPSTMHISPAYYPLNLIPRPILSLFFKPGQGSFDFSTGADPIAYFTVPFISTLFGIVNSKTILLEGAPGADINLDAPLYVTSAIPISPVQAKALAAILLTTIFGARVLATHWLVPAAREPQHGKGKGEGKGKESR